MEKSPESYYSSDIEKISQERTGFKIPEYRPSIIRSASQDSKMREEANHELYYEEEAEKIPAPEQSQPVDLVEFLSVFKKEEMQLILENMIALQLTEGCNGRCPFCFLSKKEEARGVIAHFTFSSLKKFFEKSPYKIKSHIAFYWKSDIFDWCDEDENGKYTFVDLYKTKPCGLDFISTAIPKGGEQRFIDFAKFLFEEQLEYLKELDYQGDHYYGPLIRISVGKHNISRVEYTLKELTEQLRDFSHSKENIEMFFHYCVIIENRFEPRAIGPLIASHDDIREANSFACSDGVVITPTTCSGRVVVTPTVFEPTGEKVISLTPEKTLNFLPSYLFSGDVEKLKNILEKPFLDFPKLPSGEYLELENRQENAILYLGRGATALSKFMVAMSTMEGRVFDNPIRMRLFFKKAFKDFYAIKQKLSLIIEQAEGAQSEAEEKEKLDFYVLLAKIYISQVEFFLSQYKKGSSIEELKSIAQTFRGIGRNNVSQLPEIMKSLSKTHLIKMVKRKLLR